MGVIIFNGKSSRDYGIVVETPPDHAWPEKDYDVVHVPGRNGDLLFDNGSYKNVARSYEVALGRRDGNFYEMVDRILTWLHSASGYARLEDSYEPEYYRLAAYREGQSLTNILGQAGRATITFDCKPQRYLKEGEEGRVFTSSGRSIWNPTLFTSFPLIKMTMTANTAAVLTVNNCTVSIAASTYTNNTLCIDSELQDVYSGTSNKNSIITLNTGSFPVLSSGDNEISFSGGITKVEVVPKWWTL